MLYPWLPDGYFLLFIKGERKPFSYTIKRAVLMINIFQESISSHGSGTRCLIHLCSSPAWCKDRFRGKGKGSFFCVQPSGSWLGGLSSPRNPLTKCRCISSRQTGVFDWDLVGGGSGGCYLFYNAQDSPPETQKFLPTMSAVLKSRKLG